MTETASRIQQAVGEELAKERRFVAWEFRGEEDRKVPVNPHTGSNASVSDPETWGTLEEALERAEQDGLAGVGIVLGGGLAGVDLDECRDPETGEVRPWAKELMRTLSGLYWEISPSGTGFKGFGQAAPDSLPSGVSLPMDTPPIRANGNHTPGVEIYTSSRYFTLTSRHVEGTEDRIRPAPEQWANLKRYVDSRGVESTGLGDLQYSYEPTGEDVLPATFLRALEEDEGLRRIWEGEKEGDDTSRSGYDASLAARMVRADYEDWEIEAALRQNPHGQIGTGKLEGREADRQIRRLIAKARTRWGRSERDGSRERPEPEILRGDVLLEAGPPEKDEPLVPRFVWPGRITTLAGREKSGKSSLSAYITAAFTTGGDVLNRTVSDPGSVLWVTTPSEAAQIDPALDLQFFGGDPGRLYVLPEVRWRDDPIGEIHRAVETVNPDMVVVDSLSSIVTSLDLDLGSDSDWISVYQDLHSVAKGFGVGVLLVHHARRSDDRYRGSGGIGQSTDVLLELMEREEDQPRVRRIYPKGRARRLESLELEPYKIQLTPDMDDYVYLGPISGSGDGPDQEILNYVRANDGCSTSDVQKQVGIRDTEVTKKLESYEKMGVLSSVDHGPGKATTWHFEEQTEMEGPFK